MRISVVIATYNRRDLLTRTLPTVLTQDFPADEYEVIVVVDGSTDGTIELLRGLKPACALRVLEQVNRGPAAARNAGIRAARGDLVLLLDDDLLCDRGLLREHVAAHQHPGPLLVFGPVAVAPESRRTLATDWTTACTDEYIARLAQTEEPRWPQDIRADANGSVPRSELLASGGFNERFVGARETDELGLRLWKRGVRFRYRASAVTHHIFVKSARDLVQGDAWWYGRNEVLLCQGHPDYRAYSPLLCLAGRPLWRLLMRRAVARLPFSIEPLLRVPFWVAERFRSRPAIRRLGLRLLQARQGIVSLRSALAQLGSWESFIREFGMQLPVLLYHHVGPPRPNTYPELTVPSEQFERHMKWLARERYVGIRPSDWLAWCREGKALPKKPVLLTFDDAYADVAEYALPVLKRHGFGGVVLVVTGQIGGENKWDQADGSAPHRLMTAQQIREWAAQGIEFGAHSRTHPDLTKLTADRLGEEVAGSGEDLTSLLGGEVVSFAYPYGPYNEAARLAAQRAFPLAFTCDEGLNTLSTDPHLLRRTKVLPNESMTEFGLRVHLGWNPILRVRARLRVRSRAKRAFQWVRERGR